MRSSSVAIAVVLGMEEHDDQVARRKYERQLRELEAEEAALKEMVLELNNHKRKLTLESVRLLEMAKEKQTEFEVKAKVEPQ